MKLILLLATLLSLAHAYPDKMFNNKPFYLPPESAPDSEVQKADFYQIPALVISLFSNELQGKNLFLDARWDSPYFGAGIRPFEGMLGLMVLGGTARIDGMSHEAYAALICHELGHVIGGAPYQDFKGAEWSSSEGQSDFFAASICLPRYLEYLGLKNIPKKIEEAGWFLFKSMAPHSSETRAQRLQRGKLSLPAVNVTTKGYPSLQCRYETFRSPSKRSSCWHAP